MSELPEFVRLLVNGIANTEGFNEFTVETQPGSKHGDNFIGVIVSIIITGTRTNFRAPAAEEKEKLYLLCKLPPATEARRQEFQSARNFKREVLMYSKVLPLFEKFQREKGLTEKECFLAYPKCYAAIADEKKNQFVVIMEDLRQRDFVMWPKNKVPPVDHSYLVMEKFAKLHAISFALKDQRPEVFQKFREMTDIFHYFLESKSILKVMELGSERAIKVLENPEHAKILEEVKENLITYFDEYSTPEYFEPFAVINHGDSWNNNIMYQYDEGVGLKKKRYSYAEPPLTLFSFCFIETRGRVSHRLANIQIRCNGHGFTLQYIHFHRP